MLITSRCSGMFDRHRLDDQDYQFLDMFESSIGLVTNRESQLFDRFNRASRQSARWLARHRRSTRSSSPSQGRPRNTYRADPVFPDALLDIDVETSLLSEIKDIRDELNIIAVILDSQTAILGEFEGHVTDELRGGGSRRATDALVYEIRRRSREQRRLLEVHRKDVDRMDRQAESIYMSLTHLLDLKQKHSNALEARFARDQAVIAARQGQTIMVFTIVTIIFLPMSFIAAFFAINFADWGDGLTIKYVSKYLFGIGLGISIPLIAMAFTVADIFDGVAAATSTAARWFHRRQPRPVSAGASGAGTDYDAWDDLPGEKIDGYPSRPRTSLADTVPGWRNRAGSDWAGPGGGGGNLAVPRTTGTHPGGRKVSVGSGNAVSWARPSFDHRRFRVSEDLERGRGEPGSVKGIY